MLSLPDNTVFTDFTEALTDFRR